MPTADYDAGCRVRSTSTKCPTRKSRTSSSPPISRPENALASRLLFRQFSKSLAKTCKSGSRKALLHLALESRDAEIGELGTYQLFSSGGQAMGGMVTKAPLVPAPFWLHYFNVDELDAAVRRVRAA